MIICNHCYQYIIIVSCTCRGARMGRHPNRCTPRTDHSLPRRLATRRRHSTLDPHRHHTEHHRDPLTYTIRWPRCLPTCVAHRPLPLPPATTKVTSICSRNHSNSQVGADRYCSSCWVQTTIKPPISLCVCLPVTFWRI